PPVRLRNLAKTIGRRRISFPLCYRWRSVKDQTSKFTEPTTIRRMEHVFAITFTSSILPTRISWLWAKPPAAVRNSAPVAVRAFEKGSNRAAKSLDEKSRRSKNHAGQATRPGSSRLRKE